MQIQLFIYDRQQLYEVLESFFKEISWRYWVFEDKGFAGSKVLDWSDEQIQELVEEIIEIEEEKCRRLIERD